MSFPFFGPGVIGGVVGGLREITLVAAVDGRVIPEVEEGDMIIAFASGSLWIDSTYSPGQGFSTLGSAFNFVFTTGNSGRGQIVKKIATGDEGGQSINLVPEDTSGEDAPQTQHAILVFRGNSPFTSIGSAQDYNYQFTSGNPAAQVKNVVGVEPIVMVFAVYIGFSSISPRGFTPSKTGEYTIAESTNMYLAWKFFFEDPQDTTIDMGDHGHNMLVSFYTRLE